MLKRLFAATLACVAIGGTVYGASDDIARLYTFTPNTSILSSQVNAELDQFVTTLNNKGGRGVDQTWSGANTFTGATLISGTTSLNGATTFNSTVTLNANPLIPNGGASKITLGSGTAPASLTTAGLYWGSSGTPLGIRFNGTALQYSNDGSSWNSFSSAAATTSTAGIVVLAQNSDATTGTDTAKAMTPAASKAGTGIWLIGSTTASTSASLQFTSGIDSTYDKYIEECTGLIPATNGTYLKFLISEDAGSTWKTGANNYQWGNVQKTATGAQTTAGSSGDTLIDAMGGSVNGSLSNGATGGMDITIEFKAPSNTARNKQFYFHGTFQDNGSGFIAKFEGMGLYKGDQAAINGVQILMSSGNITSGVCRLYGVRAS